MASMTLTVFLLFGLQTALACVVTSVPLGKSNSGTNTKVTIKDGQSQTIQCAGPRKVVSIVEAKYVNQSPKSSSSDDGIATPCNSDTSIRKSIRTLCLNKPSCAIKANDNALQGINDPTCKTRRPLVVEYQCTAPAVTLKSANEKVVKGAMVSELV